jgi:hypothetical protein
MSDRSWFYAAQGQQQGPFPEAQFRSLIARNAVTADTLVWTEGMADWQRARDIPGLMSRTSGWPAAPPWRAPQFEAGDRSNSGDRYGVGGVPLSFDAGLWELLGQSLLYAIGMMLVVPAPWLATGFYRWGASRLRVPHRPNLAFNGQPMDIWWALAGIGVLAYFGRLGHIANLAAILGQAYLTWTILRWIVSNLSSNGQPLPITFNGSALTYIGWHVLVIISVITIVGWAWSWWRRRNGFAATSAAPIARSSSTRPDWRCCGGRSCSSSPASSLSRSHGRCAGTRSGWSRNSNWSIAPCSQEDYLRSRTEPSCATEATSVPSCLKIRPRVSPRPPCALGESWAYNSHSSARNGR